MLGVADGVADVEVVEPGDGAEIARFHPVNLFAGEALEPEELADLALLRLRIGLVLVDENDRHARLDRSAEDTPDADAADVVGEVDARDEHLQRLLGVSLGMGDVLDDRLEDRAHVAFFVVLGGPLVDRPAALGAGEDDWKIELVVVGAERDEQVEDLVDDPVGLAVGAVALVDDHRGLEPSLERFAQHEPCLGHGALKGIDDQEAAVGEAEDAFDLAAEVGVARGIDDVDAVVVPVL